VPTTVCHAKAGRENRCRGKAGEWQFGLLAGAKVYGNEFSRGQYLLSEVSLEAIRVVEENSEIVCLLLV
jgi:hypothetical protein